MRFLISRHLAPMAFSKLVESLPLEGAASLSGKMLVLLVNLTAPADKMKRNFEAGDVAYDPRMRALCVMKDRVHDLAMAHLGVVEDMSSLSSVKSSDWFVLRLDRPQT
jgi:hypothetical protein